MDTSLNDSPEGIPMNLGFMTAIQMEDSKRWFPYLHDGRTDLIDLYTLGMAGEVGEFANLVKKRGRILAHMGFIEEEFPQDTEKIGELTEELHVIEQRLKEEHVDILCYWMNLSAVLGTDAEAEWRANRQRNAVRFGGE